MHAKYNDESHQQDECQEIDAKKDVIEHRFWRKIAGTYYEVYSFIRWTQEENLHLNNPPSEGITSRSDDFVIISEPYIETDIFP